MCHIKVLVMWILLILMDTALVRAMGGTTVQLDAAAMIGQAEIGQARLSAISEAKRLCVKQVLCSDLLDSAKCVKHAEQLEAVFLRDPSPYIGKLFIDNEEIVDNWERYQVTVTASVLEDAMKVALVENGIEDTLSVCEKPTVMILVKERFETRLTGTHSVETVLVHMFQKMGFSVIDPDQKQLNDLRKHVFSQIDGNLGPALQGALGFKADYLVMGEAVVTSSGPLSGTDLKARYANLNLKIVDAVSGEVVASETGRGKAKHIDELTGGNWALETAADEVGEKLLSRFGFILEDQLKLGVAILIDVYGLADSRQANEVEALLRQTPGVSAASQQFYFSGVAQFELKSGGGASKVAKTLSGTQIGGQPLEVVETLPRYLHIRRRGEGRVLSEDSQKLFAKYLEQKYEDFDIEKAREQDQELIGKMNALAQSKRISDDQKKQLYTAKKEIEEKRQEAFYRQKELEKREQELAVLNAREVSLEEKYDRLLKALEDRDKGTATVHDVKQETTGTAQELQQRDVPEDVHSSEIQEQEEKSKRTGLPGALSDMTDLYEATEKEIASVRQEIERTRNSVYAASRNQSNAKANWTASAAEYATAIKDGVELGKQISDLISSIF
jgi:hypothetical protein